MRSELDGRRKTEDGDHSSSVLHAQRIAQILDQTLRTALHHRVGFSGWRPRTQDKINPMKLGLTNSQSYDKLASNWYYQSTNITRLYERRKKDQFRHL